MKERGWFIVHTYAGQEHKAKANLEQKISTMHMEDKIFQIIIPQVDILEIKGKKTKKDRKCLYPGYLLVEMIGENDVIDFVRNTPGITGFVTFGREPIPLQPKELDEIFRQMGIEDEREKEKVELHIEVGQRARILEGPFADSYGIVQEVDVEKRKVKLSVNIFNRETIVEVNINQIEEI